MAFGLRTYLVTLRGTDYYFEVKARDWREAREVAKHQLQLQGQIEWLDKITVMEI